MPFFFLSISVSGNFEIKTNVSAYRELFPRSLTNKQCYFGANSNMMSHALKQRHGRSRHSH